MNFFYIIFFSLSIILLTMMADEDNKRDEEISNCYENGGVLVRGVGSNPYICVDKGAILK